MRKFFSQRGGLCLVALMLMIMAFLTFASLSKDGNLHSVRSDEFRTDKSVVICINTATVEELCELDGIGEVLAHRIVQYRIDFGKFEDKSDLLEVDGIGENLLKSIEPYIRID